MPHNELLMAALDKQVLAGKLIPRATQLLHDIYCDRCEVSPKENAVFLNGEPLDAAVAKLIDTEFDYLKPPKDTSAHDAIEALKAEALSGNVSAHGRLHKEIGDAAYQAWRIANKAEPGKAAAPQGDTRLDNIQRQLDEVRGKGPVVDESSTNPYKMKPGPERNQKLAALMSRMPTKMIEGLARAAGQTIDGRPLRNIA